MLRFGCAVASLWLLLILGGYRHEILAPTLGRARADAVAGASGVCELQVSTHDTRFAQDVASACRGRAPVAAGVARASDATPAAAGAAREF